MQQRQPRLGDILDDYCPRERRVTNHAVVAMVGDDVKQTRCTTCDADHEYKHAKVPRQRRKVDAPALTAQAAAGGPKRITHETAPPPEPPEIEESAAPAAEPPAQDSLAPPADAGELSATEQPTSESTTDSEDDEREREDDDVDGPVHRPLIRATLPRTEGQPPPQRPAPDFTIRQPGGRQNRFRPRHQRGGQGQQFFGNRGNGNPGPMRSGSMSRQGSGGRPPSGPTAGRPARHHGPGRKRSK